MVDDGLATGSTMRAAVAAVRGQHPATIIVAVPVGSRPAVQAMRSASPTGWSARWSRRRFLAVGGAYADFTQLTDRDVAGPARLGATQLTSASVAAGQPDQFGVAEREHRVRDAAGRPEHRVRRQRPVDQRADRLRMPDRGDAADRLAGVGADEVRRGPLAAERRGRRRPRSRSTRWRTAGHDQHTARRRPRRRPASWRSRRPRSRAGRRRPGPSGPARSRIRTRPGTPAAARMALTAWQLGCRCSIVLLPSGCCMKGPGCTVAAGSRWTGAVASRRLP